MSDVLDHRGNTKSEAEAKGGARERIECKSNITSPEWHPELVMRCDLKVMNFEFVSEFVLPLKSGFHVTYFSRISAVLKTSFFAQPLFFFFFVCFFFSCSHHSRCSKLSCANLTRCEARGRCWMSNWTRKRIKSLILSFWNLSNYSFFTSRFWKWESNVVRSYNCINRCTVCVCAFSNKNDFSLLPLLLTKQSN